GKREEDWWCDSRPNVLDSGHPFARTGSAMTTTSPTLLERLRDHADSSAWSRLVGLYTPLIRGWLLRVGVRPGEADDLVQEVLAVVVRRFPEFRHNTRPGAFRAWLRAIAVNCARDLWKANRLRPAAPGGTDF